MQILVEKLPVRAQCNAANRAVHFGDRCTATCYSCVSTAGGSCAAICAPDCPVGYTASAAGYAAGPAGCTADTRFHLEISGMFAF